MAGSRCARRSSPAGRRPLLRTDTRSPRWAHVQALTFIEAHWKHFGQPTAYASATVTGNMGFRAPVRLRAYRLRPSCDGAYRVYTRVESEVRLDGRTHTAVYRPDTCG